MRARASTSSTSAFELDRRRRARAPGRRRPSTRSRPCRPTAARRAAARRSAPGNHRDQWNGRIAIRSYHSSHATDSRVRVAAPRRTAARGRVRVRHDRGGCRRERSRGRRTPAAYVRRLAAEKSAALRRRSRHCSATSESVAHRGRTTTIVLGADTAVGRRRRDPRQAARRRRRGAMLRRLSGRRMRC